MSGLPRCLWCFTRGGKQRRDPVPHDCPDHGPGYVPPGYDKRTITTLRRMIDDGAIGSLGQVIDTVSKHNPIVYERQRSA